jgi:transposase InsO family protein
MVDPKSNSINDELMQRREPDRREERLAHEAGRLPYPGEVVGNKLPPYEVTGLDALSPLLVHVDFPASKEEIVARIGQARVPVSKDRTETVADILARTAPGTFRSSSEVERAVAQVWDQVFPHEDRGSRHFQRDNLSKRPPN